MQPDEFAHLVHSQLLGIAEPFISTRDVEHTGHNSKEFEGRKLSPPAIQVGLELRQASVGTRHRRLE
jgi:hypothetical protein